MCFDKQLLDLNLMPDCLKCGKLMDNTSWVLKGKGLSPSFNYKCSVCHSRRRINCSDTWKIKNTKHCTTVSTGLAMLSVILGGSTEQKVFIQ